MEQISNGRPLHFEAFDWVVWVGKRDPQQLADILEVSVLIESQS